MATYKPPSFPRKPNSKHSYIFSELQYQARLFWYRYEVNTALYVMSLGEKLTYNLILLSFTVLVLAAFYYYLPPALHLSIQWLSHYFTASNKLHVAAGREFMESSRAEDIRNLGDGGKVVNACDRFAP